MQATRCPICFGPLEVRQVTPCCECGHHERELAELKAGRHVHTEYLIFGLPIVLCNFRDVDFRSYLPSCFGLLEADGKRLNCLEFVRTIDPATQPRFDKYCPDCDRRLAFLEFLFAARAKHARERDAQKEPFTPL